MAHIVTYEKIVEYPIYNRTATSMTCYIENLDPSYSYNNRMVGWYLNGEYKGSAGIAAFALSGGLLKIDGLLPNQYYNITANIFVGTNLYKALFGWEWSFNVQNSVNNNTDVNMPAMEWLAFYDKINLIRSYKKMDPYNFTKSPDYISTGKSFFDWIFKQAAIAINEINNQVAPACLDVKSFKVSMGDDSKTIPWYFENLKIALNRVVF